MESKSGKGRLTRRDMLKVGAALGAGILAAGKSSAEQGQSAALPPQNCPAAPVLTTLTPFLDPLPIPAYLASSAVVRSAYRGDFAAFYDETLDVILHQFHKSLPPAPSWGFNGMTPGPTINAWKDRPVQVRFTNNLHNYILCPDPRIHGAPPEPWATIHAHGILDRDEDDGFPENRFPPGTSYTNQYPNIQEAATYWYHDHSLGVTRLNIYSGLYAFYLLRDHREMSLRLPQGEFEVPLVINDKEFNADGTLWFPFPWQAEFFGRFTTVNQKVWPYFQVKRGKYRFRMLNGSTDRFYRLTLTNSRTGNMAPFIQIGTDGGFLPRPVPVQSLLLAPAERADVILDFSSFDAGDELVMTNDAPAPFPSGPSPAQQFGNPIFATVMKFVVARQSGWMGRIPGRLCEDVRTGDSSYTRNVGLIEVPWQCDPALPQPRLNNLQWGHPPTETPLAGSTETWNIINTTPDTHPIHLHQTQFRIIRRRPFDAAAYLALWNPNMPSPGMNVCSMDFFPGQGPLPPSVPESLYTGPAISPDPNEMGLKDTVRSNPGQVTTIRVPFGPFKGLFVWHCHMLSHEDNEMMRPLLLR